MSCARCRVEDVPGLGLAELPRPFQCHGLRVVRVDLHREPIPRVEQLDQQWEPRAALRQRTPPEQRLAFCGDQFGKRAPVARPADHPVLLVEIIEASPIGCGPGRSR